MPVVNLSPVGGVAAQFLDNNGNVLSGGKLFTYAAGTTTPAATYTSSLGITAQPNPIVLDAAGRVPDSGEIWLTDGVSYKFVLQTSTNVLIATYDNITGINPTVNAEDVVYDPPFTGGVTTNVENKLSQTVSVKDFGAVGDGIVDDTTAFQAAVDLSGADVLCIDLAKATYVITTVNVPSDKTVLIQNGSVIVSGASSAGFSKVTTVAPTGGIKNPTVFSNVKFTRTQSGGSCAFVKLAWQDLTAGLIVEPSCTFNLSNGAVGLRLARSGSNKIAGSYFMDATSTAILCDATEVVSGDAYPAGPLNSSIDNATFNGGIGFDQAYNLASSFNSFEGFVFGPSTFFYASKFFAKKYNLVQLNGCKLFSANAIFDGGYNTQITNVYADRQSSDGQVPLLTFKTSVREMAEVCISGCSFTAQGSPGNMILFTDQDAAGGTQITNVTIGDSTFIGGLNDPSSIIRGITFSNVQVRNVSISSTVTFRAMYACVTFGKSINRSIINCFSARDITWYVENVATGISGGYNKFDAFYNVINLDMVVPTFVGNGVDEQISLQTIGYPTMPSPPVATVTTTTSYPANYFTLNYTNAATNYITIQMRKTTSALTGQRGQVTGQVILDRSQYQAPW